MKTRKGSEERKRKRMQKIRITRKLMKRGDGRKRKQNEKGGKRGV